MPVIHPKHGVSTPATIHSTPVVPAAVSSPVVKPLKAADVFRPTPVTPPAAQPVSKLHFVVHPEMEEVRAYANSQGWTHDGYTQLSIPWQELVYTTDHWKTTQVLKSFDVPSPIVNGTFTLPNVPKGTEVEFALHVGVACHAPGDIGGYRNRGDVWLNNNGQNFTQVSQ